MVEMHWAGESFMDHFLFQKLLENQLCCKRVMLVINAYFYLLIKWFWDLDKT